MGRGDRLNDAQLIDVVWEHYKVHARSDLPWRHTTDPYKVLVSEVMLQQTQVSRVVDMYRSFLHAFPNTRRLAKAPLADVLLQWQGLGYNRRAKLLQQSAVYVLTNHNGRWPRTCDALKKLPGIGPYTAGAVMAFAYNQAIPIIETNIRTVFLHHMFSTKTDVTDQQIQDAVIRILDHVRPREWYWALMDYGAYIKKMHGNCNHRAASYKKQPRFVGSKRQIRGAVLRHLSNVKSAEYKEIASLSPDKKMSTDVLGDLQKEGLIEQENGRWRLPQ